MSYYKSKYIGSCTEATGEYAKDLAKLSYDKLIKERSWFESLHKNFENAKRLKLIPEEMTPDDLRGLLCAYRKAVKLKEREILRKALWRGR